MLTDNFRIYNESVNDIDHKVEDSVCREESFRDGKSLICRIIQGTLEPLYGRGDCRIQRICDNIA